MYKPRFIILTRTVIIVIIVMMPFSIGWNRFIVQDAEANEGLFLDVFTVGSIGKGKEHQIVRTRYVNINFGQLTTGGFSSASEQDAAKVLPLNLFEDVQFIAVFERIERVSEESYSWIGHINGVKFGRVILTIGGSMLAGSIELPGAYYSVAYAGNGVHAIYEVDQSKFDPCGGAISVDRPDNEELMYRSSADDGSIIDVMVVYTEQARLARGGTTAMHNEIDSAISYSNMIYENSQINQRINLVHKEEVVYSETGNGFEALTHLMEPSDSYMDNIHTLRNTYIADCVVLIIENFPFYCGAANLMTSVSHGFEDSAFSVVKNTCLNTSTFPHELAHNMGARHDWYLDPTNNSPFTYNHGYVNIMPEQDLGVRTVMAYLNECTDNGITNCLRVPYFSNPDILAYDLYQIGIPEGTYHAADNRKTLNNTAYTVANFRAPEDCSDGIDNDGDGLVDCYDHECDGYPYDEACADGLDNDCDELVDCADPECDGYLLVSCNTGEPGVCAEGTGVCVDGSIECSRNINPYDEVCDDDLDNDCDWLIDDEDADCSNHQPFKLPDTGQSKCYNDTQEITCPQPGELFYGQDAQYCSYPQSYTKLDQEGVELEDSAISWAMIRDNLNGLIWEAKTEDGSIHDGANEGNWNYANRAFIDALNAEGFGGFFDWRIPSVKEMSLIVNRENPSSLNKFFPNTGNRYYWSSNLHTNNNIYVVYFWDGDVSYIWPTFNYRMRAVRGIQPSQNFVSNGDGTVTDTSTGLMWEVKTDDGGIRDKDNTYLWKDALLYCETLIHAGYDDWRLPNINELVSLVHYNADKPKINTSIFPNTQSNDYWSSTTYHLNPGWAWKVAFSQGYVKATQKYYIKNYVRAVRGGRIADDYDCDTILNNFDNCFHIYNPDQEDTYPPGGNGIGNACDCEGNFDCDPDADGTDAATFKIDFGHSIYDNPCTADDTCNGDFSCDGDVDGTDAALFKQDFGRSQFSNPCPSCVIAEWCGY